MRETLADLGSLLATGLRGLRSRWLLTIGSVLLAAIAVAAAVVGPMYQSASAASYVVSKLRLQPDYLTGVTLDYTPLRAVSGTSAERLATEAVDRSAVSRFVGPQQSLWSRRLVVTTQSFTSQQPAQAVLAALPDCGQLVVAGRCPRHRDETLLLAFDAHHTSTSVGDTVAVTRLARPLRVVGTYRLPSHDTGLFNDPSRFTSVLPQPTPGGGIHSPYYPAPLVVTRATVTTLQPGSWFVRSDYQLRVDPTTTLSDLQQAVGEVSSLRSLRRSATGDGRTSMESGNALRPLVREAQVRRDTAKQTVAPAVLSLILVALVLLVRLLAAATDLRRPELALASLRGIGRRQLWALGLLEPVLMLLVATPVGLAAGYLAARALTAAWLVPGLPLRFGLWSVAFGVGVAVAALGMAALTVKSALDEPLSSQIAGVRRPTRSGRWKVVSRLALIAGAVVVLAVTLRSSQQSKPTAADLALPILLAGAAGLLMTLAAGSVAGWQARRSTGRRGTTRYVASRTIARRHEGTWAILPLTASLAIAVFAAGIYATAASWRASEAATEVGADTSYQVRIPLAQALALTHQVDPRGRWLMAAAADADQYGDKVLVDAPRLARVAVWPDSWTPGMSLSRLSTALSPAKPALRLTGRRLRLTVDSRLRASSRSLLLSLDVVTRSGLNQSVLMPPFRRGRSTSTARMPCAGGCQVAGLSIGGPGPFAVRMKGTVTIGDVRVDGAPVPYFAGVGWRNGNTDPRVYGPEAVTGTRTGRRSLTTELDSHGRATVAQLVPADVPTALPAVLGRTAALQPLSRSGDELKIATSGQVAVRIHPVATAESTPYYGPSAVLLDANSYIRSVTLNDAETTVYILARGDTPDRVVKGLAADGISSPTRLADVRRTLDQDAYALALNLYAVVTVLIILLALTGLAVNMAVQIPARRRDAASLRVVGLPRRSIVAAVTAELTALLASAAVAGILAGALSQYVVVRTVTLGYADSAATPRVLPSLDLPTVSALLVATVAVLLVIATALGNLTIRGARTSTLRETAA
jgi:putative ABC transport system permease protein